MQTLLACITMTGPMRQGETVKAYGRRVTQQAFDLTQLHRDLVGFDKSLFNKILGGRQYKTTVIGAEPDKKPLPNGTTGVKLLMHFQPHNPKYEDKASTGFFRTITPDGTVTTTNADLEAKAMAWLGLVGHDVLVWTYTVEDDNGEKRGKDLLHLIDLGPHQG